MNIENKPESNIQSRLLKSGMRLYIFAFLLAPLQYIIRLMVSNALSPEQIGIIATVVGAISIVAAYVDLGLREALNYYIPKYIHHNQKDKTTTLVVLSFVIQTIIGIVIASLLWWQADNIAAYYRKVDIGYIIKIFAVNLVVANLFTWLDGLFLVVQDVIRNKGLEIVRYLIYLAYIVYIYMVGSSDKLFDYSVYFLIGAFICSILSIICLFYKYKDVFFGGKFDLKSIQYRPIQKYAFGVLFMMNIAMLLGQLDIQFALKFVSTEGAGYYNNGLIIVNGVIAILSVIGGIVYPMISELDAKQDHHKTNLLTGILLKYISIISGILGIFIWFFGVYMCVMFFGTQYIISGEMLKYIALFMPFGILMQILYMVLAGKGDVGSRIRSMLGGLLVMLIGCIFTTKGLQNLGFESMGINGIALSLGVTRLTLFLISYRALKKVGIDHSRDWGFMGTNIIVATGYCLLISNIYHIDLYDSRLYILLKLGVIFGGYIILLGAVNYKTILSLLGEIGFIKNK